MSHDTRRKNVNWRLSVNDNGTVPHSDAELAVMMDIRDELQALNEKLGCHRVRRALDTVERIDRRLKRRFPLPKGRQR